MTENPEYFKPSPTPSPTPSLTLPPGLLHRPLSPGPIPGIPTLPTFFKNMLINEKNNNTTKRNKKEHNKFITVIYNGEIYRMYMKVLDKTNINKESTSSVIIYKNKKYEIYVSSLDTIPEYKKTAMMKELDLAYKNQRPQNGQNTNKQITMIHDGEIYRMNINVLDNTNQNKESTDNVILYKNKKYVIDVNNTHRLSNDRKAKIIKELDWMYTTKALQNGIKVKNLYIPNKIDRTPEDIKEAEDYRRLKADIEKRFDTAYQKDRTPEKNINGTPVYKERLTPFIKLFAILFKKSYPVTAKLQSIRDKMYIRKTTFDNTNDVYNGLMAGLPKINDSYARTHDINSVHVLYSTIADMNTRIKHIQHGRLIKKPEKDNIYDIMHTYLVHYDPDYNQGHMVELQTLVQNTLKQTIDNQLAQNRIEEQRMARVRRAARITDAPITAGKRHTHKQRKYRKLNTRKQPKV